MRPDPLVERIATRMASAEARAERLRGAVPLLVRELRRRGAHRVTLFGSLVTGAPPHSETDVDLCVAGLSQPDTERAELDLTSAAVPVHLVRWETASPELRAVIERFGRLVPQDEPA